MVVQPFTTPGRWLITTASGARHLLDSSDRDCPVTVARVAPDDALPASGFELAHLRRDGSKVRVAAVAYPTADGLQPGVAVGADMVLTLEPLDPLASVTIRCTTPVVSIDPLDGPVTSEVTPHVG